MVVNPTLSHAAISALMPSADFDGFEDDFAGGSVGIEVFVDVCLTGVLVVEPVVTGVPDPDKTGLPEPSLKTFSNTLL